MNSRATRHRATAAAAALAIVLAACSNDQQVADITTIAPPVSVTSASEPPATDTLDATASTDTTDTTDTEPAAVTSEVATTTAAPASTTVAVPTGPMFSDALGVKVDTAPGVNTPGDTRQLLPEGLYVHIAWQADPNDPSVFTVQPDDIEILEAYANAVREFYEAALTDLTIRADQFGPYMVDAGAQFRASLDSARAAGYVDTLGSGVVLRPYIAADGATDTTAVVLDCTISDEAFVLRADPVRPPSEPVLRGQVATMVIQNGAWKVDVFGEGPQACL